MRSAEKVEILESCHYTTEKLPSGLAFKVEMKFSYSILLNQKGKTKSFNLIPNFSLHLNKKSVLLNSRRLLVHQQIQLSICL